MRAGCDCTIVYVKLVSTRFRQRVGAREYIILSFSSRFFLFVSL